MIKHVTRDMWKYHNHNNIIVITTNGSIKNNGECVMGKGCALEAKQRYPELPKILGSLIKSYGNHCFILPHRLISFPVKRNWYENASRFLIIRSLDGLKGLIEYIMLVERNDKTKIIIPRFGCGNGKLNWGVVKTIIDVKLRKEPYEVICCDVEEKYSDIMLRENRVDEDAWKYGIDIPEYVGMYYLCYFDEVNSCYSNKAHKHKIVAARIANIEEGNTREGIALKLEDGRVVFGCDEGMIIQ